MPITAGTNIPATESASFWIGAPLAGVVGFIWLYLVSNPVEAKD